MLSIETLEFIGASGTPYPFDVFALDTVLAKHHAVYAITKRTGNSGANDHLRIFIGETNSLRDLVRDHLSRSCFTAMGANCICVYEEYTKDSRVRIVEDLLAGDSWVCNPQPR
jgi:hypothetical protein